MRQRHGTEIDGDGSSITQCRMDGALFKQESNLCLLVMLTKYSGSITVQSKSFLDVFHAYGLISCYWVWMNCSLFCLSVVKQF